MKGKWDDQKLNSMAEMYEKKYSTIIKSPNAIHLEYIGNLLSESDLEEYDQELKKAGLILSSFDTSGVFTNTIEDFKNVVEIVINDDLTKNIIYGVSGGIVYDALKSLVKKVFSKSKGKHYITYTTESFKRKTVTYGIKFNIDSNTGLVFRFDKKFTEDTIEDGLSKAKEELLVQLPNSEYYPDYFLHFDHKEKKWVKVDVMEEYTKMAEKSNKKNGKNNKKKKPINKKKN